MWYKYVRSLLRVSVFTEKYITHLLVSYVRTLIHLQILQISNCLHSLVRYICSHTHICMYSHSTLESSLLHTHTPTFRPDLYTYTAHSIVHSIHLHQDSLYVCTFTWSMLIVQWCRNCRANLLSIIKRFI